MEVLNSTLTDTTQLSWLESHWEQMYEGRNPLIVTGVFAFLMHELVYFGRFIPFLICDFIPYFQKYKLQQVKQKTKKKTKKQQQQMLRLNRIKPTQMTIIGIVLKKYFILISYLKDL